MRITGFFTILAVLAVIGANPANAGPKPWYFSWWPSHWDGLDFKPHINDPKIPHNTQWDGDSWTPQDWINDRGSSKNVLDGLYASRIITRQYVDNDIPVLEVGRGFMRLSAQDQRRVAVFVDHVFGITGNNENGLFYLHHADAGGPIGLYTKHGLQLQ
jgi:hypothetical protein